MTARPAEWAKTDCKHYMVNCNKPLIGLSLMIEDAFLKASRPLFNEGEVEILEWTFDVGWGETVPPDWVYMLLDYYSRRGRLIGHGVTYSPLSAGKGGQQKQWLSCLKEECRLRHYKHISEHFGWMAAGAFYQSTPLPLPRTKETVRIGVENLKRLSETANTPIGLENLAFAFGLQDVREQGLFLEQLLQPIDGFLLLDLHNIYCQSYNFQLPAVELLETYPLQRVREIHISGGSWSKISSVGNSRIRRDTHDGAVPEEVFNLLRAALRKCPNIEAVIFERIGNSLNEEKEAIQFRNDFKKIRKIVKDFD